MESGKEMGAAFAVYLDGEPIIDMWAGYADRDSRRRWRNNTITTGYSISKGVLAILCALMVDRLVVCTCAIVYSNSQNSRAAA